MKHPVQSVTKLSQSAATRLGDFSRPQQGAGAGVTRSTTQGSAYHAGNKTSFLLRYSYAVLTALGIAVMYGAVAHGIAPRLILVCALAGLIYCALFWYWSSRNILQSLPGTVWYDDNQRVNKRSYLHDNDLGLHGSPDYIMEYDTHYYVVEYKTTVRGLPSKPSYKHLTQLVAYHVILEKKYPGKMSNFGYLIYQSRASNRIRRFRYTIDDFMKREVLRNLAQHT